MNANPLVNRHSSMMMWLVGVILIPIDFSFLPLPQNLWVEGSKK
jgi:hypothetical protein